MVRNSRRVPGKRGSVKQYVLVGVIAGVVGAVGFQLWLTLLPPNVSLASAVFGSIFLLIEIPVGILCGVVAGIASGLVAAVLSDTFPLIRLLGVGLVAFAIGGGMLGLFAMYIFESNESLLTNFIAFGSASALSMLAWTAYVLFREHREANA